MSAKGEVKPLVTVGFTRPDPLPVDFGEHEGHQVHPHDHRGQVDDLFRCSGRFLCQSPSCVDEDDFPRGTWFWGAECPPPAKTAARRGL